MLEEIKFENLRGQIYYDSYLFKIQWSKFFVKKYKISRQKNKRFGDIQTF